MSKSGSEENYRGMTTVVHDGIRKLASADIQPLDEAGRRR